MSPTLFVAVHPTPGQERERAARLRVASQSGGARVALRAAAALAGAQLGQLAKDGDDVPLPSNGWHWSISHDAERVCGVVHRAPVGIDLERIAERRAALTERVADDAERAFFDDFDALAFARVWTAKEAVLKAAGCGLLELSRCRLTAPPAGNVLFLKHRGESRIAQQTRIGDHVLSVSAPGADWSVAWDACGAPPVGALL